MIILKNLQTDELKTSSKTVIQKTAKESVDFIGNKIANRITKVSKNSQPNNSETVKNENDRKISKEKYISPEERQETIDELRLKYYNNGILRKNKFDWEHNRWCGSWVVWRQSSKVSNNSQQNNSETITNENVKERYISSEERWKIIDNLDNIVINVIF